MSLSRRNLLLSALALAGPARAGTPPAEVAGSLPTARLHGQGRLRFLGLHVYDIRLWTAADFAPERWAEAPLALEIEYARSLVGEKIAERSIEEMRRQGELPAARATQWLAEMTRLFPDVGAGDRLTGVHLPGGGARFYLNGQPRGELRDAEFARRFFGIWLAPQTSEPALRERLFGRGS
jgi:Chalcone isomerase-like